MQAMGSKLSQWQLESRNHEVARYHSLLGGWVFTLPYLTARKRDKKPPAFAGGTHHVVAGAGFEPTTSGL